MWHKYPDEIPPLGYNLIWEYEAQDGQAFFDGGYMGIGGVPMLYRSTVEDMKGLQFLGWTTNEEIEQDRARVAQLKAALGVAEDALQFTGGYSGQRFPPRCWCCGKNEGHYSECLRGNALAAIAAALGRPAGAQEGEQG